MRRRWMVLIAGFVVGPAVAVALSAAVPPPVQAQEGTLPSVAAPLPGDLKGQTPEALTLTYRPTLSAFKPYVATGLAYSLIRYEKANEVRHDLQPGVAGHVGFQYQFNRRSLLNFNYKYLYLAPDVKRVNEGTTPQQIGIGLDVRF